MSILVQRWGHSCVRVQGDAPVCLDPGAYSQVDAALDGVAAVLVTHEHADHLAVDAVVGAARAGAQVHAPATVVQTLVAAGAPAASVHAVVSGDELRVGGLGVQVLGEWHRPIHRDLPAVHNVGYLVEGTLLHPGDAYLRPQGVTPDTLLVPLAAPWLLLADLVDWVRELAPRRLVAIHDALLSPAGVTSVTNLVQRLCGLPVTVLDPGESVTVD